METMCGKMGASTKATIALTKNTAKERTLTQMVANTMENGSMVFSMA